MNRFIKAYCLKPFYALSLLCIFAGCVPTVETKHKVELEVKPMHITIDVNLKVDKELDDFFGDIDNQDATMKKEK